MQEGVSAALWPACWHITIHGSCYCLLEVGASPAPGYYAVRTFSLYSFVFRSISSPRCFSVPAKATFRLSRDWCRAALMLQPWHMMDAVRYIWLLAEVGQPTAIRNDHYVDLVFICISVVCVFAVEFSYFEECVSWWGIYLCSLVISIFLPPSIGFS